MPRVIFQVDEHTRALMVEAAHRELVSLSEWLRRAAEVRLNGGLGAEAESVGSGRHGRSGGKSRSRPASAPNPPGLYGGLAAGDQAEQQKGGVLGPTDAYSREATQGPGSGRPSPAAVSPPAASPRCTREARHHINHSGKPCPECGYPTT
jgi:hypothetical protein